MASSSNSKEKDKVVKKDRWMWSEEKTEAFLQQVSACKRQKLGEGIEWDTDKVVLFEHVRGNLAQNWPEDFGLPETTAEETSAMSKEQYKSYADNLRKEKDCIADGYRRVANKFKSMKRLYTKDAKDGLRSGAGQLTAKYWHECHELWGGSAGTEPLDFGFESAVNEELSSLSDVEDSVSEKTVTSVDGEQDANCDESNSAAASGNERKRNQRVFQSTAKFVDCKREKLQKKMTGEGKKDALIQLSQKQTKIQESMLEALTKQDEGMNSAIKSMA